MIANRHPSVFMADSLPVAIQPGPETVTSLANIPSPRALITSNEVNDTSACAREMISCFKYKIVADKSSSTNNVSACKATGIIALKSTQGFVTQFTACKFAGNNEVTNVRGLSSNNTGGRHQTNPVESHLSILD